MGSIRIDAVWFRVYPSDHLPPHVHGITGEIEVIVDLLDNGTAVLSPREKNPRPSNAKRSEVCKVLNSAAKNYPALKALWEKHHAATTTEQPTAEIPDDRR